MYASSKQNHPASREHALKCTLNGSGLRGIHSSMGETFQLDVAGYFFPFLSPFAEMSQEYRCNITQAHQPAQHMLHKYRDIRELAACHVHAHAWQVL